MACIPRGISTAFALAFSLGLAACGGGGGGGDAAAPPSSIPAGGGTPVTPTTPTTPPTPTEPVPPTVPVPPPAPVGISDAEAGRFLTQASFGVTDPDITTLKASTYSAWLTQQMAMAPSASHQAYVENRLVAMRVTNANATLSANQFYESFWGQAASGPDQLRQRVKFALSQIFVISLADANVDVRGAASYYDMLGANAFGNFRSLLENVTLHPMMGIYLTSLANQKEDDRTGRHPDENYAREVMQLMSLGLYELNIDGSYKLNAAGAPVPSYTPEDISNLAKVFTGMSWYHPAPTNSTFFGGSRDANATVRPMILYSNYHSISAKRFLGVTIPATTTPDPAGDIKIALDTIFNHPNVGPFIARRLIQQLVTSNPSPAYVGRVAAAFNNNGSGTRGDMAAVVRAVLTDVEARDAAIAAGASYGKLREPIVRMANWMRAFNALSTSGSYLLTSTSASTSLGQSPLAANSVFNFYRPGYVPPNTRLGNLNLTAPEFQIVDEVSVAGYLNTLQTTINTGIGSSNDVRSTYANEVALANDPTALVERVNRLLLYGQMSPSLKARIIEAVSGVAIPGGTATPAQIDAARLNRAKLAIFMAMASPDYLIQR